MKFFIGKHKQIEKVTGAEKTIRVPCEKQKHKQASTLKVQHCCLKKLWIHSINWCRLETIELIASKALKYFQYTLSDTQSLQPGFH